MTTAKKIEKLRDKLRKGKVRFRWIKLGNEVRMAHGTLVMNHIPLEQRPIGGKGPTDCLSYYDLDIMDWRSVSIHTEFIWIY